MMNPLPFPPKYSQQVIRHASSGYPLTTEYIFTSKSSRDRFYQSRKELPSLEHPNIHRILAVDISSDGRLFTVSVHSEEVEWTLQRACLEKWRSGEEWSSEDVKVLVDNVLAGLQFAGEKGFSAVDLQWTNIAVTDDGYKLMALSKNSGGAILGNAGQETMELGHIQPETQSKKDAAKEQIYALGSISLFLLSPENQELFETATDLRPHVESLSIAEDLKQLLLAMLHPDPTQRPTAEQLQTSGSHTIKSISDQLLTTLCDAMNCKNWDETKADLSQLFSLGEVKAELTFPCSACKSPISLQPVPAGTVEVCPRHLVCKVGCLLAAHEKSKDSVDCPCCVRERAAPVRSIRVIRRVTPSEEVPAQECVACSRSFRLDKTEKWRLDYMGTQEYSLSETICSLRCMRVLSEQALAIPQEMGDMVVPMRAEAEHTNLMLKGFYYMTTSPARGPQGLKEMQEPLDSFLAIIQENILMYTSGFTCHLCLCELSSRLYEGRWLICGTSLAFVCSQKCFERQLQVDVKARKHVDHTCPTCGCVIRCADLTETLDSYLEVCGSCKSSASWQLPCRHFQCDACYQQELQCDDCLKIHRGIRPFRARPHGIGRLW